MPLTQLALVDTTQLEFDLEDVADAIRAKSGGSAQLAFPAGFISEIGNIPTGITPTGTKQITENGTFDVTQYASAEVNVSGGGGGIESASGQIVLASADANTHIVVSGLSFTPNAFLCYGETSTGKTSGGMKFAGFRCLFTKVYANDPPSSSKTDYVTSNLPDSLFDLDATSASADAQFCKVLNDGFELLPAQSNRPFEAGVTYYWKAWRFE